MSKKHDVQTDPKARLKLLAAIALAEATDGRGDPDAVKPYLKKISTAGLQVAFIATKYCLIQRYIIEELYDRENFKARDALELLPTTEHQSIKQLLCDTAATIMVEQNECMYADDVLKLFEFEATESINALFKKALQNVPKGELPKLLEKNLKGAAIDRIVEEFKRRNDPIGENLLQLLAMEIPEMVRNHIGELLRRDPRVMPQHILVMASQLPDDKTTRNLFYAKIAMAPIDGKKKWYQTAEQESFRLMIVGSFSNNIKEALPHIDYFFYALARTDAVRAAVIRTLGPHLPLEKLLELRSETGSKTVTDVFANIFGDRYQELQKFLAS